MKKQLVAFGSLLLLGLLEGCTQAGLGLANLPARFSSTQTVKAIAYGAEDSQKLDIYLPETTSETSLPVLLFFYGGRWTDGSRQMYPFVGETFAKEGYITVIADHSKYPEVRFPAFVEDGAAALAWVYRHIGEYGGDPERIYLSGHSSGAHIGALLVADERYTRAQGVDNGIIRAFAGLAGPYDFEPDEEDLKDMFGPPENYPQMQVTTFIEGDEPPMLLLWGDSDTTVWRRNLDLLAQQIRAQGGQVETQIYPGMDHVGIVASLTWFYQKRRPVLDDMLAFFNRH
ncbi:alpha/beta hydrolase [Marinobacterium lutimaris]|uniref:Acetyl esterase/lipase n=1 Tax=Marinobacterium lutimaris TaxID=568106 RepID=A0A1H5Z2K1_9GAMM|nr:alpha/beta hydrolase [Marinobacterium lutimaris]SEG30424.1 Acetyl esterase/lipase [Marinobacterium lutimaris]